MRNTTTHKLAALVSGTVCVPSAWAHPGHEHSPELLAYLVHSVTSWGPLLIVLVLAVAAGFRPWKSHRQKAAQEASPAGENRGKSFRPGNIS